MLVSELRKALAPFADDATVSPQVISQEGGAWNMEITVGPVKGNEQMCVLQLKHPYLVTLPRRFPNQGSAMKRADEIEGEE